MSQYRDSSEVATTDCVGTCYRQQWFLLAFSVVLMPFVLTVAIKSTIAAYWNINGQFGDALIFSGIFSCLTLLCLWRIAAYFRFRLYVGETAVTQVGVFRVTTLPVADVVRVVWQTLPVLGTVVLRTSNAKVSIEFNNFTSEEQRELIGFCRETWDESIQEGWPRFAEHFPEGTFGPRRRPAVASAVVNFFLFFSAVCFFFFWYVGSGVRSVVYLVGAILNVLFLLWKAWSWAVGKRGPD